MESSEAHFDGVIHLTNGAKTGFKALDLAFPASCGDSTNIEKSGS